MSWHFLREEEEDCWPHDSLDGAPSALSRLIPTADDQSSVASATDASSDSPSGTTSARSTRVDGGGQLTLLPEAFLARTSVQRVPEKDCPAKILDFGSRCSAALTRFDLVLSSPKTARICVPLGLAKSSKDLPAWGMTLDGECWELGTSVRRTSESACGLWPTPTTQGNEFSPYMGMWPAHRAMWDYLAEYGNLPTPVASDWKQTGCASEIKRNSPSLGALCSHIEKYGQLPTPTAKSYGYNKGGAAGRVGRERPSIDRLARGLDSLTLREWMMGWPIGWTASEPLAMGRFHSWLQLHGEF